MKKTELLLSYAEWFLKAKTLHGLHSSFIYSMARDCFYRNDDLSRFAWIEKERKKLLAENTVISYADMGAGVRKFSSLNRANKKSATIADIAKRSLQKPFYCRILHRMIQHFDYREILEMGTSLGITTTYLASASSNANVYSIEGDDTISSIAQKNFNRMNIKNIQLITGVFDHVLPSLLPANRKKWDMVYIDGNHNGEALLNYFHQTIKHLTPNGVIILDDIRWSDSMYNAWKLIQETDLVTLTIDLLKLGIVFINPDLSKENIKIKINIYRIL